MTYLEQIQKDTADAIEQQRIETKNKQLEERRLQAEYEASLLMRLPSDVARVKEAIKEAAGKGFRTINFPMWSNREAVARELCKEGFVARDYRETFHVPGGVSDTAYDQEYAGITVSW